MRKGNILLIVLLMVGIITTAVVGYFLWQQKVAVNLSCQQDSDCVIGIQTKTDSCCICPRAINRGLISNDWEVYVEGKNYGVHLKDRCKTVDCQPCEPLGQAVCVNSKCRQKWVESVPPETKTDETANWKTYTSTKYGFSIKYPDNWSTHDNTQRANSQTLELYLINVPEGEPLPDNFLGMVRVYEGVNDLLRWFNSEVEFTEAKKQEFINLANEGNNFNITMSDLSQSYRQMTVLGYPAIEETILCHRQNCYFMAGPQNSKHYLIKKGETVVSISFLTLVPDETFPILDKMISSFFWFQR